MQKCLTVYFSGHVQGVGFRFTAERLAHQFSVKGFVRNLPNGKVQIVAEGEEDVLQQFYRAVCESSMASYIRDTQTEWGDPEHRFRRFEIVV